MQISPISASLLLSFSLFLSVFPLFSLPPSPSLQPPLPPLSLCPSLSLSVFGLSKLHTTESCLKFMKHLFNSLGTGHSQQPSPFPARALRGRSDICQGYIGHDVCSRTDYFTASFSWLSWASLLSGRKHDPEHHAASLPHYLAASLPRCDHDDLLTIRRAYGGGAYKCARIHTPTHTKTNATVSSCSKTQVV